MDDSDNESFASAEGEEEEPSKEQVGKSQDPQVEMEPQESEGKRSQDSTERAVELPESDDVSPEGREKAGTPSETREKAGTPSEAREKAGTPSEGREKAGTPSEAREKAGTPSEGKEKAGTPSEGREKAGTPSEAREKAGTPSEGKEKAGTPSEAREKASTPSEGREKAGTPSEAREKAGTPSEGKEKAGTPSEGREKTGTPSEAREKAGTPSEGKEKAGTPSEGREKAGTPSEAKEKAGTPSEGKEKAGTPSEGREKAGTPSEGREKAGTPSEGAGISSEGKEKEKAGTPSEGGKKGREKADIPTQSGETEKEGGLVEGKVEYGHTRKETLPEGEEQSERERAEGSTGEASHGQQHGGISKQGSGGDGGGWGWGGWSTLWSSVSNVTTESAQALSQKVSSVIASVEDTLGLPSPQDLAEKKEEGEGDEEISRLAEEIVEHDVPPEDQPPVQEEPHSIPVPVPDRTEQGPAQQSPSNYEAFAGFFSGIASAVQSTGKGLVTGGLDALETLGKKTMEVLAEGDPGLQKKRAVLGEGPTLSQLLKEAKSESEAAAKAQQVEGAPEQSLNYSRLFDEYQGVVHLEALELLSRECETKVRSGLSTFTGDELQAVKDGLEEISQAFKVEELPEVVLEDDSSHLSEVLELFTNVTLPLKVEKLIKVSESWRGKVEGGVSSEAAVKGEGGVSSEAAVKEEGGVSSEAAVKEEGMAAEKEEGMAAVKEEGEAAVKEEGVAVVKEEGEAVEGVAAVKEEGMAVVKEEGEAAGESDISSKATDGEETESRTPNHEVLYENGLRSLAELTSASVELFRKMAEVSLIPSAQKTAVLEQAQKFNRLTVLVSSELDSLASVHAEAITKLDIPNSNSSITSLYLEASNSCSYVHDAFQLLTPILQFKKIQQSMVTEPSAHVHTRS